MSVKHISAIVGLILGFFALGGGSWAAWDLRQEVADNTTWRVIQTYEQLSLVRSNRRLTPVEWIKWCKAGRDLKIFLECPPR